ncbi:MAG: hypothetical protein V7605_1903 [Acidimicrobiaceae bacterium]|jgi:hypothetical protein
MKTARRNTKTAGRGARPADLSPVDFWRAMPDRGCPAPISPASDPTALLRSLGKPPLPGQAGADRHVATVIERASILATALAAATDLLATVDD